MRRRRRRIEYPYQFFKIILPSTIRDRKLDLPSKFVRKVGNTLSDVAILKVPTDQVWKVELKKSDKIIWFCNGWQEFAEYHSIRAWHFLVFKYIGSSRFDVLIFDMTGTEIQYPCDAHNVEDSNNGGECSMHHENKETKENDDDDDDDDSIVFLEGHETCTDQEESIQTRIERVCWASMTASVKQKAQKSIEAAQAFKSKYPFYMLVMYSTYIHRDLATVNEEFANRYLPGKKGSVLLKVSGGRTWNVNYVSNSNTSLTTGWNKFTRENELKVGDFCVFELVNRNDLLLKVSILRNGKIVHNGEDPADSRERPIPENEEIKGDEDDNDDDYVVPSDGHESCRIRDESDQLRRANIHPCSRSMRRSSSMQQKLQQEIEAARAFKSKNPFYMLVMSSKFVRNNYATVKASFSTRYLPDKILGSLTLMVSDGRTWHVSYSSKRNNTNTALTKGWNDFVRENDLKEGDVCVFELINRDVLLLKVSFFRNAKKRDRHIADNVEDRNYGRQCTVPKKNEINENDSIELLDVSPDGHETCTNQEESIGMRLVKKRLCNTSMRANPSKKRKEQRENEAPREHKERKAIQAAEAFKSKNPSYICVMCSAYVRRCYSWVPLNFARRYLSKFKLGSLILTVPDGRTWPVNYISRRNYTSTSLCRGWATFVKDNGLEEGDVCVFELVDRKNLMLKVFIFRDAKIGKRRKIQNVEGLNDARKCSMPGQKEIKMRTPNGFEPCTNQEESDGMRTTKRRLCSTSTESYPSKKQKEYRAIEAAGAFKSENPFYIRVMRPAYLRSGFIWVLPNFAKMYLPKKKLGSLTLIDPDGRTWAVNYVSRNNNSLTKLTRGWYKFVKEIKLKEGDVCVFELINRKNLLLKVSIFRVASML